MKQIKFFLLMMLLSSQSLLLAENPTPSKPKENLIILRQDGKSNHKRRPRCPSRQVVYCSYDGESVQLNFAYSEGSIDIYVENGGNIVSYTDVCSEDLEFVCYVGMMTGSINISVETDNDNTYVGTLIGE